MCHWQATGNDPEQGKDTASQLKQSINKKKKKTQTNRNTVWDKI